MSLVRCTAYPPGASAGYTVLQPTGRLGHWYSNGGSD
jgi:hypothetical protein